LGITKGGDPLRYYFWYYLWFFKWDYSSDTAMMAKIYSRVPIDLNTQRSL
jgi:hypothetical protein